MLVRNTQLESEKQLPVHTGHLVQNWINLDMYAQNTNKEGGDKVIESKTQWNQMTLKADHT